MSNFYIPYQGGKQSIVKRLFDAMEAHVGRKKYFVDLFGGGGAVTFEALKRGYKVIYNEPSNVCELLKYIIYQINHKEQQSKYGLFPENWYKFVSRNEYNTIIKSKPTDLPDIAYREFVGLVYSFGNGLKTYFCSRVKETYKKAGHHFVILKTLKDFDCFLDRYECIGLNHLFNDILSLYPEDNYIQRLKLFHNIVFKLDALHACYVYDNKSPVVDTIKEKYNNLNDFYNLTHRTIINLINQHHPDVPKRRYKQTVKSQLQRLQQLERLQRLEQLEQLQRLEQLAICKMSYDEVDFEKLIKDKYNEKATIDNTIVYCDPPYKNTAGYNNTQFNYNSFITFLQNIKYHTFISEYTKPYPELKEVVRIQKRRLMAAYDTRSIDECLFTNTSCLNVGLY